MEARLDELVTLGMHYGLQVIGAIAILLIGRIVAGVIRKVIRKMMAKADADPSLIGFVARLAFILIIVFSIVAALAKFGIETASFVAILGAASFAIGFALQGSLSNFASGVLLVLFKPYKVGDSIEAGGASGSVVEIQIFSTVLRTGDNKTIIVPNTQIMSGTIVNNSANENRRIDLVAGCGYDDDLDKVRKVLEELIAAEGRILDDPAHTIAVSELADSSVNFIVRPWVKSGDYSGVMLDMNEAIKKRFDKEGISFPFPQQDVHLYKAD